MPSILITLHYQHPEFSKPELFRNNIGLSQAGFILCKQSEKWVTAFKSTENKQPRMELTFSKYEPIILLFFLNWMFDVFKGNIEADIHIYICSRAWSNTETEM